VSIAATATVGAVSNAAVEAQANGGATRRERRWQIGFRRPVSAALILLLIYVGLSYLNAPRGYLGTDTGGKTATLKVMDDRGDLDPDVGYWARQWDPEGRVHGLYYSAHIGDRYINVTSLPMVLAAEPLYRLGGYRLALLAPMAGAILAAFAARAISRRVRDGDGWAAFWIVGLASPMTIYALDFWEHSLGVGLVAAAAVLLWDAAEEHLTWWRGLAAGALIGSAFTMRTEALAYGFAMVGVTCLVLVVRRRALLASLVTGAGAAIGLGAFYLANSALERAVLGSTFRSGRTVGAASAGGGDSLLRVKEAVVTAFSPLPSVDAEAYLLGACLAVGLAYLVWLAAQKRRGPVPVVVAAIVGFLYLYRFSAGVGFVPGLVAATPLAVAGVVLGWRRLPARLFVAFAIVPLPLVFYFQFPGGAVPQWAGRYILTSGVILAAVGVACLPSITQWIRRFLIGVSIAVTVFGLVWLSVRSHGVQRAADGLENRPEAVLISPNGFVPREFGGSYGRKRWLASGNEADLQFAASVALGSGAPTFGLVDLDTTRTPPTFPGWTATGSEIVPFLSGVDFRVTTYVQSPRT
jgi:hypothetical protein